MEIAVTVQHSNLKSPIDPRFGRAPFFVVTDVQSGEFTTHHNAGNSQGGHAAGIQAAAAVVSWDARAVITGNIGPKAFAALRAEHVKVYPATPGTVLDVIRKLRTDELQPIVRANVQEHFVARQRLSRRSGSALSPTCAVPLL